MTEKISITEEELVAIKDRVGGRLYHVVMQEQVLNLDFLSSARMLEFDIKVMKPPEVGEVVNMRYPWPCEKKQDSPLQVDFMILKVIEI